jgi:hypothetical protein
VVRLFSHIGSIIVTYIGMTGFVPAIRDVRFMTNSSCLMDAISPFNASVLELLDAL